MPRAALPPRLYLDPKRKQWVLRFKGTFKRLPFGEGEREKAEVFLRRALRNREAGDGTGKAIFSLWTNRG